MTRWSSPTCFHNLPGTSQFAPDGVAHLLAQLRMAPPLSSCSAGGASPTFFHWQLLHCRLLEWHAPKVQGCWKLQFACRQHCLKWHIDAVCTTGSNCSCSDCGIRVRGRKVTCASVTGTSSSISPSMQQLQERMLLQSFLLPSKRKRWQQCSGSVSSTQLLGHIQAAAKCYRILCPARTSHVQQNAQQLQAAAVVRLSPDLDAG